MTLRRGLTVTGLALLFLAGTTSAQHQPSRMQSESAWATQHSAHDSTKSSWITLSRGGAVGTPDGPELRLSVSSKKGVPLDVKVTFRMEGAEDCVVTRTIAPSGKAGFACTQSSLVAEKTYPVTIEIFKQGKSKRVDRLRFSYRFGKNDIARLEDRIARMKPGR